MLSDFISLIFPDVCSFCSTSLVKGEEMLCSRCILDLPKTNDHVNLHHTLLDKFYPKPVSFAYSYLSFSKAGITQKLLHQLKYEGNEEIGMKLGLWYGSELVANKSGSGMDLIVPVPLHRSKLRTRGYNQSDCFAKGLSETLQIEFTALALQRTKKTVTQTRMGKLERWKNVDRIFKVRDELLIRDRSVILVDDIITTGATLNSCIDCLLSSGATKVAVLTIARAA